MLPSPASADGGGNSHIRRSKGYVFGGASSGCCWVGGRDLPPPLLCGPDGGGRLCAAFLLEPGWTRVSRALECGRVHARERELIKNNKQRFSAPARRAGGAGHSMKACAVEGAGGDYRAGQEARARGQEHSSHCWERRTTSRPRERAWARGGGWDGDGSQACPCQHCAYLQSWKACSPSPGIIPRTPPLLCYCRVSCKRRCYLPAGLSVCWF